MYFQFCVLVVIRLEKRSLLRASEWRQLVWI